MSFISQLHLIFADFNCRVRTLDASGRSATTKALLWWLETHPDDFCSKQMEEACSEFRDIPNITFHSVYRLKIRVNLDSF
jgi:hypothetical protein